MKHLLLILTLTTLIPTVKTLAEEQKPKLLLQSIQIPGIDLEDTDLVEATDYLVLRSREIAHPKPPLGVILHTTKKKPEQYTAKEIVTARITLTKAIEETARTFKLDVHIINPTTIVFTDQKDFVIPQISNKNPELEQLLQTKIPVTDVLNVTIEEILDFLTFRIQQAAPNEERIKFTCRDAKNLKIPTLMLRDATAADIIRYTNLLTNTKTTLTKEGILIEPAKPKQPQK